MIKNKPNLGYGTIGYSCYLHTNLETGWEKNYPMIHTHIFTRQDYPFDGNHWQIEIINEALLHIRFDRKKDSTVQSMLVYSCFINPEMCKFDIDLLWSGIFYLAHYKYGLGFLRVKFSLLDFLPSSVRYLPIEIFPLVLANDETIVFLPEKVSKPASNNLAEFFLKI